MVLVHGPGCARPEHMLAGTRGWRSQNSESWVKGLQTWGQASPGHHQDTCSRHCALRIAAVDPVLGGWFSCQSHPAYVIQLRGLTPHPHIIIAVCWVRLYPGIPRKAL